MPSETPKQARLMRAALHGATFPKAAELRRTMTIQQLRDFSTVKPTTPPPKRK